MDGVVSCSSLITQFAIEMMNIKYSQISPMYAAKILVYIIRIYDIPLNSLLSAP